MKLFNPETHSLSDFVRLYGGISTKKEELKGECRDYFSISEGYNLINNKTGKSLDYLLEAALEAGFLHFDADIRDLLDDLRRDVYSKKVFRKGCIWSLQKQDWTADYADLETMVANVESCNLLDMDGDYHDDGIIDLSPWDEVEEFDLMPESIYNLYYGGVCHGNY
mgnify:CR=1 FL=1